MMGASGLVSKRASSTRMSSDLGRLMRWVIDSVIASVSIRSVSVSIGSGIITPLVMRMSTKGRWPGNWTLQSPFLLRAGEVRLNRAM